MNIMPFLLFAFVASITPGPTNILILNNSQHFGVRATIPALVSGCVAASLIVLVSGAGPIGIMAAAVAKHVGARHVVITDVNEYRLDLARKMGVTRAVDVSKESLTDVMEELGMTEGFDVGLEMSGAPPAFRTMLDTMNHGGRIAMLGIPPSDMSIDWTKVIFKGLFIKGIYGREMFETWYKMAALIQSGLDLSPIITHRFGIDEFQQGFDAMRSGQSGKVILSWD